MYGLFQTSFYFGYSTLGAISIGIICGRYTEEKGVEGRERVRGKERGKERE